MAQVNPWSHRNEQRKQISSENLRKNTDLDIGIYNKQQHMQLIKDESSCDQIFPIPSDPLRAVTCGDQPPRADSSSST